ncbi:MAG: hypothetical protein E6J62_00280 [Deltaproteobacteria bacterium]|nr:MAG: hypothetical protein E6J62_00280 [Deltaproteobacteria bacterium]
MNALYDPAIAHFDPDSPTRPFVITERDLTYSKFRPDLAAAGAEDGRMPSLLPPDNNDALSRRDMGLEFLDVTRQVEMSLISTSGNGGNRQEDVYRITNKSSSIVDTHLLTIVRGLSDQIEMDNASGLTSGGDAYRREFLPEGVLLPGQSIVQTLVFKRKHHAPRVSYTLTLLSGQGNP